MPQPSSQNAGAMWNCRRKVRKICSLFIVVLPTMLFLWHQLHWNGSTKAGTTISPDRTPRAFPKEHFPYLEQLQYDLYRTFTKFNNSRHMNTRRLLKARKLRPRHEEERVYTGWEKVPNVQCTKNPFLLIEIHSNPVKFLWREAIRLSWGRQENDANRRSWVAKESRTWKTVFLIGRSNDSTINELILEEAKQYRDIVLGDFPDTYRNLYKKMVLSIKWSAMYCPAAKYVLKTDEDCYVNVHGIIRWLSAEEKINRSTKDTLYAGALNVNLEVIRDPSSRYFVSKEEYPEKFYHPYVAGGGYIFSGSLLPKLMQSIRKVRIFPVEDASFGLLMQSIGVRPRSNTRFLPFLMDYALHCSVGTLFECDYPQPIFLPLCELRNPLLIHDVYEKEQILMHFNVLIINYAPSICIHLKRMQ